MTEGLKLSQLPPLREVIKTQGLSARKPLGQNFILDLNITDRIASVAGPINAATILEIGPGPGGLTRSLLAAGAGTVIAVERDTRCISALQEIKNIVGERLIILNENALNLDLTMLTEKHGSLRVIANLPYNISTRLLLDWLKNIELFDGFFLMFQKEVADRLTSPPGSKSYGRLSVAVQWRCKTRALFTLPPTVFVPPPKVFSTLVELIPRPIMLDDAEPAILEKVVYTAFSQRRKMMRSSMRRIFPMPENALLRAGILPTARAESVTIGQFCALARILALQQNKISVPPGGV